MIRVTNNGITYFPLNGEHPSTQGSVNDNAQAHRPCRRHQSPRFAGLGTFARLPQIDRVPDYDIAIVGVPFDGGTSFRPGARFGPAAVREASRLLRPGYHPELDVEPVYEAQVVDAGDIACTPYDITRAVREIEEQALPLMSEGQAAHLDRWRPHHRIAHVEGLEQGPWPGGVAAL